MSAIIGGGGGSGLPPTGTGLVYSTSGTGSIASSANLEVSLRQAASALTSALLVNNQLVSSVANPVGAQDAVNLQTLQSYAAGISTRQVRLATTTSLAANTYSNGVAGVGATLTANSNGAIANIDGQALALNDRILVKDEGGGTSANNGIYFVTNLGSSILPWILTRALDADTSTELAGVMVRVDVGSTNASNIFIFAQDPDSFTIGTTNVQFVSFTPPNAVPNTRTLTASTGLTGGGDLSANRSFAVAYGTSSTTATVGNDSRLPPAPSAQGKVLYDTGSAYAALGVGTSGQFLQTQGASANPQWATVSVAVTSGITVAVSALNITISNPATAVFDGVTLTSGQALLLVAQSTASQNGAWIFNGSSSALTRPTWFATGATVGGFRINVNQGNAYANTEWVVTSIIGSDVVDTNNLTIGRRDGSNILTPPPVASTWSVLNGATITDSACGVNVFHAATASDSIYAGIFATISSGTFDIRAHVVPSGGFGLTGTGLGFEGIAVRNTTSGTNKSLAWGQLFASPAGYMMDVRGFNSSNAIIGDQRLGNAAPPFGRGLWLRITGDGTNVIFWYCGDGIHWFKYYSEAFTTTLGAAPTQAMLFVDSYGGDTNVVLDHFVGP